ncbi:MAG: IS110 family transposase [Syntrophaceae bacterium]|nr:IS110 family transposase [Syntrophaceae bacterium]
MSKIRRKPKIVNSNTLLVTVDISKDKHTGYFRCPDGTEVMPFEFSNDRSGFTKLYQMIESIKYQKQLTEVILGFESTGPFAEPLVHYLKGKDVKLVQVNTAHTKKLKEVYDNSPGKTDRKDPKVIADLVELGRVLNVVIPEGICAELRRLTHARERYIKTRNMLVNQLYDLSYIIFPELGQIIPDFQSKTAQYLLRHYPTPQLMKKMSPTRLETILRKVSRGRYGKEQAERLYQVSIHSVGIREGLFSIVEEIKNILKAMDLQNRFIDKCEEDISRNLVQIPLSRELLLIKGIGEITVAGVIGEVVDFTNFTSTNEIEKYAGLNLFEISSGKHQGQRRISKRGRSFLRKVLYFAALNTIRKGGAFHEKFQQYQDRGMPGNKALIAIARKLLRVMFAMARDQKEFKEDYHHTLTNSEAA